MKKIIAFALSFVLILSVFAVPVSAAETEKKEKCPIIFIAGSSIDICDAEGNEISTGFDVVTDDDEGDMTTDKIIETAMNILRPFILEGLPFNKWDNYGEALYEELAPIWDETQLDGNGNAKYGTGVSKAEIDSWDKKAQTVNTGSDGSFGINDYKFRYDWRLSPYDHVDRLHQYIKDIIKTTKCSQVALVGRCLGGSVITAYLEKYGEEGLVKKVFYDEVMSNGSAIINDCFSGQIAFSDKHLQAYVLQSEYFGKDDQGIDLTGVNELVLELVETTLDYMTQSGISTSLLGGLDRLYSRLYKAFMPAVLRATGIGTWANYWCSVYSEDFSNAVDLVFGEEGTQTRAENAGLVEKIYYIKEHIIDKKPELYKTFAEEYGVEIGVMAGYGLANAPIMKHYDETSDCVVGVTDAGFGATASGLFNTFSDEYVAERTALGFGEYISPDKRIDASTCIFPETTWFIKNKHHDYGDSYVYLAEYFTQYSNVTVNSNNRGINRFLVFDKGTNSQFVNMTQENMADGIWLGEVVQQPSPKSIFESFIDFIKTVFNFLVELFKGNIEF